MNQEDSSTSEQIVNSAQEETTNTNIFVVYHLKDRTHTFHCRIHEAKSDPIKDTEFSNWKCPLCLHQ
jgi:hypothetical protein